MPIDLYTPREYKIYPNEKTLYVSWYLPRKEKEKKPNALREQDQKPHRCREGSNEDNPNSPTINHPRTLFPAEYFQYIQINRLQTPHLLSIHVADQLSCSFHSNCPLSASLITNLFFLSYPPTSTPHPNRHYVWHDPYLRRRCLSSCWPLRKFTNRSTNRLYIVLPFHNHPAKKAFNVVDV
ncbi:hypothetical protein BDV35DRAFT_361199 [Aspergillus flavus]|uniref:Uncharacterized protein n=1 Tax=Aspergillus flavus TaxID=5059 RepID=A0A5N6GSC9_ASPFL|nr:hypothetical protein BDV35DRAFT_361199 [Aspergillus flavus]